jgi:hypothetical protein
MLQYDSKDICTQWLKVSNQYLCSLQVYNIVLAISIDYRDQH